MENLVKEIATHFQISEKVVAEILKQGLLLSSMKSDEERANLVEKCNEMIF